MAKKKKKSYEENYEKLAMLRRMRILSRRFYKFAFVIIFFLLCAFGFSVYNDKELAGFFQDKFFSATASTGLKLERVTFEGDKYLGQDELVTTLGLAPDRPILAFDLDELRTEILKENWVRDAQVQRMLPSRINIVIEERKPIAIWLYGTKYYLIDKEGHQLTEVDSPDVLPFPLVAGEGANTEAEKIFNMLGRQKQLFDEVQSAIRMGERRWNVVFMNGIEVMLPETNMASAWEKLAHLQSEKQILDRQIRSIDLRLTDRIYIKTLKGEIIRNNFRSSI